MSEKQVAEEIFAEFTKEIDIDHVEPESINIYMDKDYVKFYYTKLFSNETDELNVVFDSNGDLYKIFDHLTRIIYKENGNDK